MQSAGDGTDLVEANLDGSVGPVQRGQRNRPSAHRYAAPIELLQQGGDVGGEQPHGTLVQRGLRRQLGAPHQPRHAGLLRAGPFGKRLQGSPGCLRRGRLFATGPDGEVERPRRAEAGSRGHRGERRGVEEEQRRALHPGAGGPRPSDDGNVGASNESSQVLALRPVRPARVDLEDHD